MDLHKFGVKIFIEDARSFELPELIPIFHRWIQSCALDDLLIDVADYSHVYAGPGVLLIAHEGNYGLDETGNRRGLVYYSKRTLEGDLGKRLATVCRKTLNACQLLIQEPELKGRIHFRGDELQVFSNDRLVAPNDEATFQAFAPVLAEFLGKLYPATEYSLSPETDPQERFAVTAKAARPVEIGTLLSRLAM